MPQLMRIHPDDNVAVARENGGLPLVHRASCENVPAVL